MADKNEALPTQQFIDVEGIENGVLILNGGSMRQIIAVSGINFDLKTEDEQNAVILGYQSFLNSLNFTLQIFIHSRKVNIDGYATNLAELAVKETNPLLKEQLIEYREFIQAFVAQNAIMNKSFYVVVPYDVIEIGGVSSSNGILGIFKRNKKDDVGEIQKKEDRARSMGQLAQRTEQVINGLSQLGMKAIPLGDPEVTELLYNLYNPEASEKKSPKVQAGQTTD
jgi:type IV secretory pathway VirB4 component